MEAALEAEEKYRRAVENIPVAVYSALPDEHSTPVVLSPKVKAITGYSSDEILGKPVLWKEIILPEDRDQVRARVEEHRRNKEPLRVQYRIRTKSGETRWVRDEARPALDGDGNVARIDGFIEDITEFKKLTDEIENRTRLLDAANRELEAFAYSVSHDLRAPLRRIDGFSEILLKETEGKLEKESARHLSRIQSAVRSMDTLIDDILRLSRLNTSDLSMQQVDLGRMAEASIGRMRSANPERKVEVKIHKGLTTTGDPNLLGIAMDNLLGNAWKFTGKRSSATIEFGAKTIDGRKTFFVRDNGVGFDIAHCSKIFDPFIRLHSESEFPGSGIGLALVKRIVARHGGEIWAESEVNKGATFFFVLGQGSA